VQDLEFRQFIERVKLRTPIEVVVGERVSALRPRGALYWACCPFHQERTPSFAVDPRRGTWRCFGACGEGGDVLSFVERFDGLPFLEALRLLAHQCGETLPERTTGAWTRGTDAATEARFAAVRWAAEHYVRAWRGPEAEAARAYAAQRGLAEPILQSFGIGWAPEGGQFLVQTAQRERRNLDVLVEVGLVRRADGGRPYDFFRGRLLIPIRDRMGRPVGFGGRLLPGGAEGDEARGPKYVNTPETPLFHKGRLIFGLDLATAAVRREHALLVVEGYTDVMAAHQAGWQNAVAVLGTATTEDHAALIRRSGARTVYLVFDGDEAGRKASMKALSGLVKLPIEIRVAVLPEGRDPGDFLVEPGGPEHFRQALEGASEWFDWCLEGLRALRGPELGRAVEERFQLLAKLAQPLDRSRRLQEMAAALALPEADVRAQWAQFERGARPAARPAAATPAPAVPRAAAVPEGPLERAFGLLLGALLLDNSLVALYAHLASACPEGELRVLYTTLLELYEHDESGAPIDASALITALGDQPARARVVALVDEAAAAESPAVLARDQARWLERRRAERTLETLKQGLEDTTPDEARQTLERLHRELRAERVPGPHPASARAH